MSTKESPRNNNSENSFTFKKIVKVLFVLVTIAGIACGVTYWLKPSLFAGSQDQDSTESKIESEEINVLEAKYDAAPVKESISYVPLLSPTTEPASNNLLMNEKLDSSMTSSGNIDTASNSDKNDVITSKFNRFVKETAILSVAKASCLASNGEELANILEGNSCNLVTLLPNEIYRLPREVHITGHKGIIGHPIKRPAIDAASINRAFRIQNGGSLTVKFLRIWRGKGDLVQIGKSKIPLIRGGSIFAQNGSIFGFGVLFTTRPKWAEPKEESHHTRDLQAIMQRIFGAQIFGGHIYISAGAVTLTNCHFLTAHHYDPLRGNSIFGGDILQGGGVLVANGCTFVRVHDFLNVATVGLMTHMAMGVAIFNGCVWNINVGAAQVMGGGVLHATAGGVVIVTGGVFNINGGMAAAFAAGIAQFVGLGVHVCTGVITSVNFGLAAEIGVGILSATAGGVSTWIGGVIQGSIGTGFLAGAGFGSFNGLGSTVLVGVVYNLNLGLVSGMGSGTVASNAGVLVDVGCVISLNIGMSAAVIPGVGFFVPLGVHQSIGLTMKVNIGYGYITTPGIMGFYGAARVNYMNPEFSLNLGDGVYVTDIDDPGAQVPDIIFIGAGDCTGASAYDPDCARRRNLLETVSEDFAQLSIRDYTLFINENYPFPDYIGKFDKGICPTSDSIICGSDEKILSMKVPAECDSSLLNQVNTCSPISRQSYTNYGGKGAAMASRYINIDSFPSSKMTEIIPILNQDQYIIDGEITIVCSTVDNCANKEDIAKALINTGLSPYAEVAISSRRNTFQFLNSIHGTDEVIVSQSPSSCGSSTLVYQISLPTVDEVDASTLASILSQPDVLIEQIQAENSDVCFASATLKADLLAPNGKGMELANANNPISPSCIIITDKSKTTITTTLKLGEVHQLLFSDFPAGDSVEVFLVSEGETDTLSVQLGSVKVNSLNQASYFWAIDDIPVGSYYIKGVSVDSPSLYTHSLPFTIME